MNSFSKIKFYETKMIAPFEPELKLDPELIFNISSQSALSHRCRQNDFPSNFLDSKTTYLLRNELPQRYSPNP